VAEAQKVASGDARVRPQEVLQAALTRRLAHHTGQHADATLQFFVNAPELPSALELIRREPKSREHHHEDEAIPDLQSPADGFEDHARFSKKRRNNQQPTSNERRI
jgi:hypothetical protein